MAIGSLLYVRVSSKEQEKEGYSLDAQEKLGEDYAYRNNLDIVKRWKVSESAWKEEREAFNQMLEYAKKHENVKHIIFDVTDRMTRNDMDKIKIWSLVKYNDKTIHFSRSNKKLDKNSGSEDEFMLDIEVAVAKKMSNDISRKTRMGMLEKAEQGLFPSNTPLGYINNKLTHLIELDEVKSSHIKKAFELIATGNYSIDMIRDILHQDGFRGKKENKVGKSAIAHILKNPIYYGVFRWNDKLYQGVHTPIISKSLYDNVQIVLSGKFRPYSNKHNFPFNNLILCGACNCKVLGEIKKNKYIYYHCTFTKGRHTGGDYIPQDTLSKMFLEPLQKITIPADIAEWLKEALREKLRDSQKLSEKRLQSLENALQRLKTRLSRLYDLKLDNGLTEEVFRAKEKEYNEEIISINAQINGLKEIRPDAHEYAVKTFELSKRLPLLYNQANNEEKAKILKAVASNYTLNYKKLYPQYRKPFDLLAKGLSCKTWLPG
jgi:site-specific DNA recombinase